MKRLLSILAILTGAAFAQTPAYVEPAVGFGFGLNGGSNIIGSYSTGLPFSPMGFDTGIDLEAIYNLDNSDVGIHGLFKTNVLPALTVSEFSASVGLAVDASYSTAVGLGGHLGPIASLELPGATLSGYLGLGYRQDAILAYGFGARVYLDPWALEVAISDHYLLRISGIYLLPSE